MDEVNEVAPTAEKSLISEEKFQSLKRAAVERDKVEPRIKGARFEAESRRLVFELRGSALEGTKISVPVSQMPFPASATDDLLREFIVTSAGTSIRWPKLNVGLGVVNLVTTMCGLQQFSLSAHQSRAGSTRTEAKRAASRANGTKGGRPRKQP